VKYVVDLYCKCSLTYQATDVVLTVQLVRQSSHCHSNSQRNAETVAGFSHSSVLHYTV